jgi:hypothetical protein
MRLQGTQCKLFGAVETGRTYLTWRTRSFQNLELDPMKWWRLPEIGCLNPDEEIAFAVN